MASGLRGRVRIADKWLVVVAVTLGMFMSLMDHTIVNVAIPQMQNAFGASLSGVQWVVTIYMLTQAVVIPTVPFLTARFGAKRAYVWSLAAFLVASVLCGLAWDLPSLVFFRFVQGIGGGTMLPLVMTLLYSAFPREERGTAVSAMGTPLMIAPAFGPLLGGFLVTNFGWPWAFFVNIPLGIVATLIAQRVLREDSGTTQIRFDLAGFLTIAAGLTTILYTLATLGENSVTPLLLLGLGMLLLLAFVRIETRMAQQGAEPLLDLRRFGDRAFGFSAISGVFLAVSRFGVLFLVPLYLQDVRGLSAADAGAILGAQAGATLLTLPLGGRLADKLGPRPVVVSGLLLMAAGCALQLTLGVNSPVQQIVMTLLLLGLAAGLLQQMQVAAMQNIEQSNQQDVANGSTLLSVLNATAAPMGVALLASFAQLRGQQHSAELAGQSTGGDLLAQQGALLGMHDSFLVAALLLLLAAGAMRLAPNSITKKQEQAEPPANEIRAERFTALENKETISERA